MENSMQGNTYGSHEVKIIDRSTISISGISKIISFNEEEFLMESNMGIILLKGKKLELIRLDTKEGIVKIKGNIISYTYIEEKKHKEESILTKLFK